MYCNPEPIVYSVLSNKKSALKYAKSLIKYRFDNAIEKKYEYGFYHYLEEDKRKSKFDRREKLIFSTCLKIKDGLKYSDDGCYIKVVRMEVNK